MKEAALTGFGLPGASASVARELIARALDETYFKGPFPTSEATFARWAAAEGPAFRATFTELARRVARTGSELTSVRAAMKGHPAHHPAMVDIEGQLGHLFEPPLDPFLAAALPIKLP